MFITLRYVCSSYLPPTVNNDILTDRRFNFGFYPETNTNIQHKIRGKCYTPTVTPPASPLPPLPAPPRKHAKIYSDMTQNS